VVDADTACSAALGAFDGDDEERAGSAAYLSATKEAARIRCTAREALAEALLRNGDPERARQTLAPAIIDLRKAEKPRHPALAEPLILDAEISLAEMQRSIAAKNAAAADRQSRAAVEALREAKELLAVPESGFDPAAPIQQLLALTLAQAEAKQKQTQDSVAQREAADAAARRALKAINATESRKPAPPRPPAPPAEPKPAE
jgi:DNA-binding SARP family transcriptional activator